MPIGAQAASVRPMSNRTACILGVLALSVGACDKSEKKPAPAAAPAATAPKATTETAVVDEAAAQRKKVADRLVKLDADTAKEAARWTPELEAKVVALRDATYASTDEALTAILASDHRAPGNADRDAYRHPRETLGFFGLTRENLMACGDGLNDRSMIAYAGVGVAMQNAEQPVKDCADYVTTADNNHDGVAEAVEKFILRED